MKLQRIAIVGGSVSGLSLALALRRHGIEACVYERSRDLLTHEGAGLMMARPMTEQIGLGGTRRVCRRLILGASGQVLWQQSVEKQAVGWGEVYGALRREARTLSLRTNCPVHRVDSAPPRIYSEQYGQERFDLVVGADGIGSVVRSRLNPGFTPRYLGYVAVRGLVPRRLMPSGMPEVMAELFDDAMAKVLLDGEHLTLYGLPGSGEPMNWMWYLNVAEGELPRLLTDRDGVVHRWSVPAGVMSPTTVAALGELAEERLPPWLTALLAATGTLFLQPIYSGFARQMAGSGLALVGDAAHLAVPHTGGGVTLALQDTLALADALAAQAEDLDTRLLRWAEARQAANTPRLEFAIRLGKSLQTAGKVWDSWSPADFDRWWTALLADAPADPSR